MASRSSLGAWSLEGERTRSLILQTDTLHFSRLAAHDGVLSSSNLSVKYIIITLSLHLMTPRASPSRHIQDGRISRSGATSRKSPRGGQIAWLPLLVVAAAVATLVITNPANNVGNWIPEQHWRISEKPSGFWSSLIGPLDTNFGLFSLSKTIDGVSVNGLLHTTELCRFESDDELLDLACGWIGMCFPLLG